MTGDVTLIDPARLATGRWCHRAQKTLGEGDISKSYSADRIGMGRPVRKPFDWKGYFWVCVGMGYHHGIVVSAEAYRLVHQRMFDGEPLTYAERVRDGDAARADANGFYHGMRVRHAGAEFVLCGPPVTFAPGQSEQLALF